MKSDAEFLAALEESQKYVQLTANWLHTLGCNVMVKPYTICKSFDDRHQHVDSGDIQIAQNVEVKHQSFDFTNARDFPHKDPIVDEKFKIDRIPRRQLWGYVLLKQSC